MGTAIRWLGALALVAAPALGQELNEETFEGWRDAILPDASELVWSEIPWRPTYWEALQEAQQLEKPVLLWAMNGHPLGCT
jgi:hypothetical protein